MTKTGKALVRTEMTLSIVKGDGLYPFLSSRLIVFLHEWISFSPSRLLYVKTIKSDQWIIYQYSCFTELLHGPSGAGTNPSILIHQYQSCLDKYNLHCLVTNNFRKHPQIANNWFHFWFVNLLKFLNLNSHCYNWYNNAHLIIVTGQIVYLHVCELNIARF